MGPQTQSAGGVVFIGIARERLACRARSANVSGQNRAHHPVDGASPRTLASMNNLALLLRDKGDYAEAEPLFRRALEAGANAG